MTITGKRSVGTGVPGYTEVLTREEASSAHARGLVIAALHTWNLENLAQDAESITAELVANAVQHSRGSVLRVSVDRISSSTVRIGVADRSHTCPVVRRPEGDEDSGRGLLLVSALAHRWGTGTRRWGKVVWAEMVAGKSTNARKEVL
ncbi:ATP-binding protein [Streptomyces sp. CA-250714]|uniref:ATP-binding protein n=1 Tax=Streptomyces sp. CA-250714 TaxID=3240060 RepID=UPI003D90C925